MPRPTSNFDYTMEAAGESLALEVFELYDAYNLLPDSGAIYLLGNLTITADGTPTEGMQFVFNYGGGVTYDGGTVSIFGRVLSAIEALYKYTITCTYINAAWVVKVEFSDQGRMSGAYLTDTTVTNAKLAGSIALSKLLAATRGFFIRAGASGIWEAVTGVTAGNILAGNGTDLVSVTLSGDATIDGTGVLTLTNNAVATANITDANVTVAKLESSLKAEVVTRDASFDAGELGAYPIRMSYAGSVTNFYGMVTKVMGGTDAGTVIVKNNAGTTMTMTTAVSIPLSTAIGTAYDTAITANNTFVAGDIITVFTAKTTAGGKIACSLGLVRS